MKNLLLFLIWWSLFCPSFFLFLWEEIAPVLSLVKVTCRSWTGRWLSREVWCSSIGYPERTNFPKLTEVFCETSIECLRKPKAHNICSEEKESQQKKKIMDQLKLRPNPILTEILNVSYKRLFRDRKTFLMSIYILQEQAYNYDETSNKHHSPTVFQILLWHICLLLFTSIQAIQSDSRLISNNTHFKVKSRLYSMQISPLSRIQTHKRLNHQVKTSPTK